MQTSQLHKDPCQYEIEVESFREKNTSRSKGGRPISSIMSNRGFTDAQYECRFRISPYISRTSNVGIKDVNAEALDEKFNVMQSSLDAVIAKLRNAPSRREKPSNFNKGKLKSRRNVSPIALSMSKDVTHLFKGMPETPWAQEGPWSDTQDFWRRR